MTIQRDPLDQRLASWFDATSGQGARAGALEAVLDATRGQTPRSAWIVGIRGAWMGQGDPRRLHWLGRKPLLALIVLGLVLAVGGAIAIGAKLLAQRVSGPASNGAISYSIPRRQLSPPDRYYAGPDGRAHAVSPVSDTYGVCSAFSPDGRRLAFLGMNSTPSTIVIAAADGSNGRAIDWLSISDLDYIDQRPLSWSPDSRKIAVGNRIFVVDDGSSWTFGPLGAMNPTWSPDGRRIAFTTIVGDTGFNDGSGTIWVVDADGSNARAVASFPVESTTSEPISPVSWSADGSSLAYNQFPSGTVLTSSVTAGPDPNLARHLFVVDVDTGVGRDITPSARIDVMGVAFAPDGSRIAFIGVKRGSGAYAIGTINGDGSDMHVQPTSSPLRGLTWSPDGTRILVTDGGPLGLLLDSVPADGVGPSTRIEGNGLYEYCWPSWQPLLP